MPRLTSLLLLLLAATGCAPEIGDACDTSIDCSAQGDRLCDTNQPGGYCTIFNCEPDTCPPGEGVCVAFGTSLDPACGVADDAEWARFERTFCMLGCADNGDCRDGYECVEPIETQGFLIVDLDPEETKICMVKAAPPAVPGGEPPEICSPSDAGPDQLTPYTGAGGAGGSGGAGGVGGMGGVGGAGGMSGAGGAGGMSGAGGAGGMGGAGGTGG